MGGQGRRRADRFLAGCRHIKHRALLGAGIGKGAGRRHREIGHAADAGDLRQFDLGGIEQQETLAAGNGGDGIAGRVAWHGELRFDLDAVEAWPQATERQWNRIALEDVAAALRQGQADGGARVDVDDDLRTGAQARRIAAGQIERHFRIIGGIEIRRQYDVEADAEHAAAEFLADDAEVAQLDALAAEQPIAGEGLRCANALRRTFQFR